MTALTSSLASPFTVGSPKRKQKYSPGDPGGADFLRRRQDDDWLCCLLQHGLAPQGLCVRQREVTIDDLRATCVDLASLMHEPDWNRALEVFGRYRDRVAKVFAAAEDGIVPPDPPVSQHRSRRFEVGAAVFAALTDAELAGLADTIRNARQSYHDEDEGHDWFCIMMQHTRRPRGLTERKHRVTRADLILTCVDLAELRLKAGFDWGRILSAFQEHSQRVEYLFNAAGRA